MRVYRNMLSRVVGIQKKEAQYYQGQPLLPKPVFYAWALADDSAFWPLWRTWQLADRPMRLTPSIDRLDVHRGYTLDNMRWITQSENSRCLTRRNTTTRLRGEHHPNAKLTEVLVREIRASSLPSRYWATHLNIERCTINNARSKRTWRHTE